MTEADSSRGGKPGGLMAAMNPPVFIAAAILIILFVLFGAVFSETAGDTFDAIQAWITASFGWLYMLSVAVFLVFCIGLAVSSYGRIKLGPDDSEPDYSYVSWFAMLFSAGMGIGLMFYGVAEPIYHFTGPPVGEAGTPAAARQAMEISFFHWGFHAWAIYVVVALSLAYFSYRHNLPLTIRSALFPIIGWRINGPIGHTVDVFAVLGTMFGVATSLGLGVMQVNSGLEFLFDVPNETWVQVILIALITLAATASVVAGLDSGIKRLSELNLFLALVLVIFVLVVGPTIFLLETFVQNVGAYLAEIVPRTFSLYAYPEQPGDWMSSWTLFYWGWWIAWSPFVGMFIARVSRGRRIREFIVGVLLVPVGVTFIWLTVFGDTALHFELAEGGGAIADAVSNNLSTALFKFLNEFPLGFVSSLVATLLVITFFVTSSDSGSLVIDIITSGGDRNPPVIQRVFWALTEGVVAAVLLLAGGLSALQTGAIASALPFVIIMLFICYGILKGLRMEGVKQMSYALAASAPVSEANVPWRHRLHSILHHPPRDKVVTFMQQTVRPAMDTVAEEIKERGLTAQVDQDENHVALTVYHGEEREFVYAVRLKGYYLPSFAFPELPRSGQEEKRRYYRAEVELLEGGQHYDVMDFTQEQVIADVLSQYEKHMYFLHFSR